MPTVTISLPDSLKDFLDTQLASKGFDSASEYFGNLLRTVQESERDARLQQLLADGLAAGTDIPLNGQFWRDLRMEALHLVEEQKKMP